MEKRLLGRMVFVFLLVGTLPCEAKELCRKWDTPQKVGLLDGSVHEASGLAISSQYSDRLYHINDSGDGPFFYQGTRDGKVQKKIKIEGFSPRDVEDLAYGECLNGTYCLILGDVGDNAKKRKQIQFVVIQEQREFSSSVKPLRIVQARYPDKARNAESIAIHPSGNLYLVSKGGSKAHVYRLSKDKLFGPTVDPQPIELEKVGVWDLSVLLEGRARIITAMDIHPNGDHLLLLSYQDAIELKMDLEKAFVPVSNWKRGENYQVIELEHLKQQEALSYSFRPEFSESSGLPRFIYNTERPGNSQAFQYEVNCLE